MNIMSTSTLATLNAKYHLFIIWSILCSLSLVAGNAQVQPSKTSEQFLVRGRIVAIIRARLSEGVGVINGIKVQTRIPPMPKDIAEIRKYGDEAVPVLADYTLSKNERERAIAIELLGLLGGQRIIKPLRGVIRNDSSPNLRQVALRWITQAPWEVASAVIREAAETDPNPKVREVANQLLTTYKHE